LARPGEGFGEEVEDGFVLDVFGELGVPPLLGTGFAVAVAVEVVGLVPDVPDGDALVVLVGADDAFDVVLEELVTLGVEEVGLAGGLDPAGVVQALLGLALLAELGLGVPHAVEEDEHRADVVLLGDGEELVDAVEEAGFVLLPEEVVEEDAHGVEAEALGPAEFSVDGAEVERVGLPHLELVDRAAGDVVAADEPGLFLVPGIRLLNGPGTGALAALRLSAFLLSERGQTDGRGDEQQRCGDEDPIRNVHAAVSFELHVKLTLCAPVSIMPANPRQQ
jgi:hypothetical protein